MSSANLAGSAVSTSSPGDSDWSNQSGAYGASDLSPATSTVTTGDTQSTTFTISVTGFGTNTIPSDATVVGVLAGGHAWWTSDLGTGISAPTFVTFGYAINGRVGSALLGASVSSTVGAGFSAGGPSTIPSGLEGVTAADVRSGTLSLGVRFKSGTDGAIYGLSVSDMGFTIFYMEPGDNSPKPKQITIRPGYVPRD